MDVLEAQELPTPVTLDEATVTEFARRSSGDPAAEVARWWVEPVDYVLGTPSTGALKRLKIETTDGAVQSIFLKLLQSPKHWPMIEFLPEDVRATFIADFPWRLEERAYVSDLHTLLPDGLRLARLYRAEELSDERIALWVEDVRQSAASWDLRRFERAARLLGQLAARRRAGTVEPFYPRLAHEQNENALRYYFGGRVQIGTLPLLDDDAVWAHPLLAPCAPGEPHAATRADLRELAGRVEELFAGLANMPQTYAHGDASPQNLLVPADAPETFVVIDWGFDCLLAVGFDLGQLLIGLAHDGELRAGELRGVHEAILPAYVEGLREEGWDADVDAVAYGYVASLLLRSAFTAIPFERLGEEYSPELAAHFADRIALTRFLLDLADELRPALTGRTGRDSLAT